MNQTITFDGGPTLHIQQEQIDVTTDLPTPNPKWTHTDAAGHEHHYSPEMTDDGTHYPTLVWIVASREWCDGTGGLGDHDGHWMEDGHWECPLCGEHIVPGMLPGGTPKTIPGVMSATIAGTTRGMYVVLPVNADTQKRIIEATNEDADDELMRLVLTRFPSNLDRPRFQQVLQDALDAAPFELFSSVATR